MTTTAKSVCLPYAKAVFGLTDSQEGFCVEFRNCRYAVALEGLNEQEFWQVLRLMNGRRSTGEISELSGLPKVGIESLIAGLESAGLVGDAKT